jgi:hypothetical protein
MLRYLYKYNFDYFSAMPTLQIFVIILWISPRRLFFRFMFFDYSSVFPHFNASSFIILTQFSLFAPRATCESKVGEK